MPYRGSGCSNVAVVRRLTLNTEPATAPAPSTVPPNLAAALNTLFMKVDGALWSYAVTQSVSVGLDQASSPICQPHALDGHTPAC